MLRNNILKKRYSLNKNLEAIYYLQGIKATKRGSLWLIHIVVWQKSVQHCKAVILQLKML